MALPRVTCGSSGERLTSGRAHPCAGAIANRGRESACVSSWIDLLSVCPMRARRERLTLIGK